VPHKPQVQRIVLLPRYTSFSGARVFHGAPFNLRAFASADLVLWTGPGVGASPAYVLELQDSPDLKIWSPLAILAPTPEVELSQAVTFRHEWVRLAVTLTGGSPGFTCWCVGDFVKRTPRTT
jgi:hypothetical protein